MKKNIQTYKVFLGTIIFIATISCEQEIDLNLPEHESRMVVEGWIEPDKGAKVILSLSAPFFAKIDSSNLRDYAVTRAKVTVRSENTYEVLTLKPNEVFFPPYYYFGTALKGSLEETYWLEIDYQNETYTATTTIPKVTPLDSSWFEQDDNVDTLGLIGILFTDNASEKNYYRVLTRRVNKDNRFIPTFTSVFSDDLFNGKQLSVTISRGNTSLLDIDNSRYYHTEDTVIIKFCSIDKAHYEFWNTTQSQIVNSANPFSATNNQIKSNIDDGFGIWGGYAVYYDTIYGKKNP